MLLELAMFFIVAFCVATAVISRSVDKKKAKSVSLFEEWEKFREEMR